MMSPENLDRDFMGSVDKDYFIELGRRIAALRKAKGLTQVQLAEILGFSQPQILSFEKGRRRIPVSLLPTLAEHLGITFEELLGVKAVRKRKRGPLSTLEHQFKRLTKLPRAKQQMVSEMLEGILAQAQQA